MVFETKILQYLFFYCIILLIVPLLYLFGVFNKISAVLTWLILLFSGISYAMYKVYDNRKNRDEIFYNEYNFNKPTRENILKSRLDQELNEKCEEPKTDEDDFDPKSIDLDVSQWKNKIPE